MQGSWWDQARHGKPPDFCQHGYLSSFLSGSFCRFSSFCETIFLASIKLWLWCRFPPEENLVWLCPISIFYIWVGMLKVETLLHLGPVLERCAEFWGGVGGSIPAKQTNNVGVCFWVAKKWRFERTIIISCKFRLVAIFFLDCFHFSSSHVSRYRENGFSLMFP